MRLYLIRHGETDYNLRRLVQGHDEIPLNDTGIAQVAAVSRRLAELPLDHIYSSDLRRTAQSAAILAAITGTPITYEPLFRERHPGDHTHQTYDEAEAFFLDYEYAPPNGESQGQFEDRVRLAFDKLIQLEGANGRSVAVMSHGMLCRAFLRCCLEIPIERQPEFWRNSALTVADYDGGWRLIRAADASHLDDSDSAEHASGA